MKRSAIVAGLFAILTTCLCNPPGAIARTPFDGAWSVLIVTDRGSCDRAYRYGLRIADGRVSYDDPNFSVSGRVDGAGRVRVAVAAYRAILEEAPGPAARRLRNAPDIGKPNAAANSKRSFCAQT